MHTWTSRARIAAQAAAPAVVLAALFVTNARAGDPPSLRVSTAGLDLGTEGGVAVLHGRIRAAAKQVCASQLSTASRLQGDYRRCVRQAVEGAVRALDVAALARLDAELAGDPALCALDGSRPRTII